MIIDNIKNYFKNNNSNKKYLFIAIVGFILMIVILLSELDFTQDENRKLSDNENISLFDYSEYLENKLIKTIESIDGAGETRVMITFSEASEYIYAKNDKNSNKITDNTNDSDYDSEYVIIEQNNNDTGLLLKVVEPKIRGVAVVCEGADDPVVQQCIYSTVSSVFNISTARISISKLEPKEK